ncbi:MAG: carboxypeptidase regulatory-like domain-containing protein [Flavobacteriales bacterium]
MKQILLTTTFIITTMLLIAQTDSFSGSIDNQQRGATSPTVKTGSITGSVINTKTGEALLGATVQIKALGIGTMADDFGAYVLEDVPAGIYTLTVDYILFNTKEITDIQVAAGKSTALNVSLTEVEDNSMKIEIVGYKSTNTEASVVMEMRDAKGVLSGLSGTQIAKSQDRNASEVARRIPGVSVVDNRFVMVRGLTERYNAVMLNGILVPSLEADVKSFSFDLIPSSSIDRFLIYKSPSADLPGEFAGGAINVITKNLPDNKWSVDASIGLGIRQGTTGKNFITNTNSASEKFGFDNGTRDLPAGFAANVRNVTDSDQLTALGKTLNNTWAIEESNATPDIRTNVSVANRFNIGNVKAGTTTAISYSNTRTALTAHRLDYNTYDTNTGHSDTVFVFNDNIYQKNVNLGVLTNWALQYKKHELSIKNFFNQNGMQSNTLRTGRAIEEGNYRREYSFNYNERSILSSQLGGKHLIGADRGELQWIAGYGMSRRNDPDWKRIRYTTPLDGSDPNYYAYVPFGAQPFYLGRLFLDLNEDIYTGAASYSHDLFQTSIKKDEPQYAQLKGGFYIENKQRTFGARNIGYAQANTFQFDYNLTTLPIDQILSPNYINNTTGFKIDEDTKGSDSYRANTQLQAYYLMGELPFEKLNVTGGVRIEQSKQHLTSSELNGTPIVVNLDTVAVLPSINVAYYLNEKMLVRAAYGKTLNRPEFREMAPYSFYDFEQNFIINGNPKVKIAEIKNYDLRWELYPSPSEILSVSVFYKEFKNPIEMYFAPGVGSGGTRSFTPGNAMFAKSYGAEIDIRKSFRECKYSGLQNFSVVANASLIESEIQLTKEDLETGLNTKRAMMGQSPYIVNAGVYYQNDSIGLQISAMYNVIGPRISIVGIPGNPEVYEMQRHLIDISITKTICENFSLRAGVQDLLNQDFIFLQDANSDQVLSKTNDQRLRYFNRGSYFSFALQYKFRVK